jgi:hypothetical protein
MARSELIRQVRRYHVVMAGAFVFALAALCSLDWSEVRGQQLRPVDPPAERAAEAYPMPPELVGVDLSKQSAADVMAKSAGCIQCHKETHDPHFKDTVKLGCCDCHGGDPTATTKDHAHVLPRFPEAWVTSANPVRSYTLLNHESPDFVRFVNPGDLRIAHISCGTTNCHGKEVFENRKSMMTHGCMLWGAALYNNGAVPMKAARYGESYSMHGAPQRIQTVPPPTKEEMEKKGVLAFVDPLPRYEMSQPGNILRIFERGGKFRPDVGIPERKEDPGRPILSRLSNRGLGTENRTDPVFIGLQKTRLLDPTLNFLGTNDNPGDYRSSGCTACHVIYANDRSPYNSGPYASAGNRGLTQSKDPCIPKNEPGHPIEHKFTRAIPTSQCIVCHIHPGTTVLNSYTGFMWHDEETEGHLIYPKKQMHPTAEQFIQTQMRNPNESATRNNLAYPEFVANLTDLNKECKHTQFADYHGHGWAFKAVFKKDRHGNLLDRHGDIIPKVGAAELMAAMDPKLKYQDGIPVHQMDVHLEKGMHCVDCHFVQDVHGNGKLQGEVRAAIEIQCIDCHGTVTNRANLRTSGPASYTSNKEGKGRDLAAMRTPFGKRRFEKRGDKIIQNSMVEKDKSWEVSQVADVINPEHPRYNKAAALAKTVRFEDGKLAWGDVPFNDSKKCAHANDNMSCIACHSAWNPSCYGCHLPQKANKKLPQLHNEGDVTRNFVSYNFQTLRDDVYMLARDGNVTGNRIGPARSSCAIHVGSYNQNRESIYVQQQTISACGLSGIAFSTNVPHTVRGKGETKRCTDCHVSEKNDNNAIMAQLLMQGTQYMNFVGRYAWVGAGEHGFFAVVSTERDEPQAVIGSTLHKLAFPDNYHKHIEHKRELEHAHEHPGKDISEQILQPLLKSDVQAVLARGEYLYAACGEGGLRVYDISFVDHKGFSERTFTAPVSPIGQQFYVRTAHATCVGAPTTIAPDPTRAQFDENHEAKVPAAYGYLYVTDQYEGLILVGAGTLLDGNPLNNFLRRELTFNPNGLLCGAKFITFVGTYAYICCDAGLVVVKVEDPKKPEITAVLNEHDHLKHPVALNHQFRYAYVCDEEGIKVLDITDIAHPRTVSKLPLKEAKSVYLARTYAYVAGGCEGLIILNIENPEKPVIDQVYTSGGEINDLHDVKLGVTYVSEFAYLADGKNGMRIVQLTSPETHGNSGFSPKPTPRLIATYKIPRGGEAKCVSKGVDRDRAVDESGNQIAVFGRIGARPLSKEEQHKMYLKDGKLWTVSDDPEHPMYGKPRRKAD